MYRLWIGSRLWCCKLPAIIPLSDMSTGESKLISIQFTFLREHGNDLEANILLFAQLEVAEAGDHLGDLLHHRAHVLPQLVHRDRSAHHGGEAGLEGHQVRRNLLMRLCCGSVCMSRPQFLGAVDGLVGGGGEDQELVPLVGEEAGYNQASKHLTHAG